MTDANEALDLALVEAALEERLGGASPPDLAAAVLAAAGRESVAGARVGSGWRWLLAAAALVVCGAGFGWWWSARGEAEVPRQGAPSEDALPQDKDKQHRAPSSEFYLPRDVADAQRILGTVDAPDVQFHFVGPHRLPTASVMGPPAPTLALGRWGFGKAQALAVRKALDSARAVPGFDASARLHTIFVTAGEQTRMRLAVGEGVLWVDGLGAFTVDLAGALRDRLAATELETRRALGLVHRDELGTGLPNELIAADQKVLRPFGLEVAAAGKLAGLKELHTLDLRWCEHGHEVEFLREVVKLTSVRELRLRSLNDDALAVLAGMRLESLMALGVDEAPWHSQNLPSCSGVTDAAIERLLTHPGLHTLVLPGSRLSRPALARLAELPKLRTLALHWTRPTSSNGAVWDAFHTHPNLAELHLASSNLADAPDLAGLARLPALEELSLDRGWASFTYYDPGSGTSPSSRWSVDAGVFNGAQQAEQHAHRLGIASLRSCAKLRRLSLGGCFRKDNPCDDATRRALVAVASTPSLRWLDLSDNPGLRLDDLLALGAAKQLDTIALCGTAGDAPGLVPTEALAPLFDAIPGLSLVTN